MAVVFPRPYAYPFAFTGTFPVKGPGSAQARLAFMETLAAALFAWASVDSDWMLDYTLGNGDAALDALLAKHKRRSAYVDVAADGTSWITDGGIMLRTSVDFAVFGRRSFKLYASLASNFDGTATRVQPLTVPLVYPTHSQERGQPHVYIDEDPKRAQHTTVLLEDLACLATLGELWRSGLVIGAKNADGWAGFCSARTFHSHEIKDVNGAPWSPDAADTRTPPEPKVKGPTWAPRPPQAPTLRAALKRKDWQRSIEAYRAAFVRVEELCAANNKHCSHDPDGVYPAGVSFLAMMKAADGFTIIDGGMQARHFLLWGGLLADRRGSTVPGIAAREGYENANRHLAKMEVVAAFPWCGDGRMDRASDGTPRLWLEQSFRDGLPDPARTPVPALDFIGALHVLTGGIPEHADIRIVVNQVRVETIYGVAYRNTSHVVVLDGELADGTPWTLIMVELRTLWDELPRWKDPIVMPIRLLLPPCMVMQNGAYPASGGAA